MKKNGSKNKGLIAILIVLIVIAGVLLAMKIIQDNHTSVIDNTGQKNKVQYEEQPPAIVEAKKEINIFNGDDRSIAVMIDNHDDARPQASLNRAYIVYEIIVEGGFTRLMPIFKGEDVEKIGPIRSSRHYFLDYAMENDAIYVHYGWSPQAKSDISKYKVNNINGITQSVKEFYRTTGKYAPHNVLTSTKTILDIADRKDYKTKSTKESVLNYVADEFELTDGQDATEITIPFSTSQKVKFVYDEDEKVYIKYANGKKQTDWATKKDLATKNIIITFAENYTLKDGSNKGRQSLNNIGTLDGYYITNGKAIKIKCQKETRTTQTVYKDLEGNEINVNDGNTFVEICPIDAKVLIEGAKED